MLIEPEQYSFSLKAKEYKKTLVLLSSDLIWYCSIKVFIAKINITSNLVFPKYAYKEDDIRDAYLDNEWVK